MQYPEKSNICKANIFHQNKLDHQLLDQSFSQNFSKYQKYVVSRVILGSLFSELKVQLLTARLFKAHPKLIPENEGKNEFAT